jgi:glycosyltransferase involved in cell wall biosynthesis
MRPQPQLSICTTIKNRSRLQVDGHELRLFPHCVASIVAAVPSDVRCELVIADWESDDWPLDEWLAAAAAPLPTQILTLKGTFSRGAGRNAAARAARADRLLFLDADCLACPDLLRRGLEALEEHKNHFPILYSFADPLHQEGWWRSEGFGNCMVARSVFESVGGFPEYDSWGREDNDFFEECSRIRRSIRERVEGFYHQWHPNDLEWKNRYGEVSPYIQAEVARRQAYREEMIRLYEHVPLGQPLILVDEAHFMFDHPPDSHIYPFLERDGQYWGRPVDSPQAIAEMERLRETGAAYIAFAAPAFWWLDHYTAFREHLEDHYHAVPAPPQFRIFELAESEAGTMAARGEPMKTQEM